MPDVKEVYEMVTQQTGPQRGALERQFKRRDHKNRNRKIGAIVVAAAIGLAAVVLILTARPGDEGSVPGGSPTISIAPDPKAAEVTTGFVEAFGEFDGERANTYLSENPILQMDAYTPELMPVFTSLLEGMGYQQLVTDPCRVTATAASGTDVRCPFEWHAIRSGEIGLGPYPGHWNFTVSDGEISQAALSWQLKDFSPQMWEPFRDWVRTNHPKDFDVMYVDDGGNFRLTEESARLWEQNTEAYVRAVQHGNA